MANGVHNTAATYVNVQEMATVMCVWGRERYRLSYCYCCAIKLASLLKCASTVESFSIPGHYTREKAGALAPMLLLPSLLSLFRVRPKVSLSFSLSEFECRTCISIQMKKGKLITRTLSLLRVFDTTFPTEHAEKPTHTQSSTSTFGSRTREGLSFSSARSFASSSAFCINKERRRRPLCACTTIVLYELLAWMPSLSLCEKFLCQQQQTAAGGDGVIKLPATNTTHTRCCC